MFRAPRWPQAGGLLLMSEVPLYMVAILVSIRDRCRANVAHVRQSRPHSDLDFHVKVLKTLLDGSLSEWQRLVQMRTTKGS